MTDSLYLLLGSNIGDRPNLLNKATRLIGLRLGEVLATSKLYETAPWGKLDQPRFLNQVVKVSTSRQPLELLSKIQIIEIDLGRVRQEKWGERKIDIDILYYNDLILNSDELIIPHPEIQSRKFTLVPLVELAPDFMHPVLLKNNRELLIKCEDSLDVAVFNPLGS